MSYVFNKDGKKGKAMMMGISKRNMDDLFNKLSRGQSMNGSFNESGNSEEEIEERKGLLNVFDEGISIKEMLTIEQKKQRTSNINDLLINTINDNNKDQDVKKNVPNSASKVIGNERNRNIQKNKITTCINKSNVCNSNYHSKSPNQQIHNCNPKLSYSNVRNNKKGMLYGNVSNNKTMMKDITHRTKNPFNINMINNNKNKHSLSSTTSSNSNPNCSNISPSVQEEYDYMKILSDLHSIFGEDLENFNETLLFNNLDELSNKGLIKGLLMLAHQQDKQIKALKQQITEMNVKHSEENKVKMDSMVILTLQLNKMNSIFKEYINENQNVLKQAKHYN